MKKTARVIVTYDCPRDCPNCCNQNIGDVPSVKFIDLLKYEEIVITGGEPMLIADRVVELIHRLRANGYKGMIWLYTAELNTKKWEDKAVICGISGINYTVHYEYTQRDITLLKRLSEYMKNIDTSNMHNRLIIDSRLKNEINWQDVICDVWDCVRWLEWKSEDCPIPENEELLFYDLEKE